MYLTYEEYEAMHFIPVDKEEFPRLCVIAGDVLDGETRFFYVQNSLEDDIPFRRDQFKKAVGAQIGYFAETGTTTAEGMQQPKDITIGRTRISQTSRYASSGGRKASIVCSDAKRYLHQTGLLGRGLY